MDTHLIAFLLILNYRQHSDLDDRLTSLTDDVQSGHSNIEGKLSDLSSDVDDVKSKLDSVESELP